MCWDFAFTGCGENKAVAASLGHRFRLFFLLFKIKHYEKCLSFWAKGRTTNGKRRSSPLRLRRIKRVWNELTPKRMKTKYGQQSVKLNCIFRTIGVLAVHKLRIMCIHNKLFSVPTVCQCVRPSAHPSVCWLVLYCCRSHGTMCSECMMVLSSAPTGIVKMANCRNIKPFHHRLSTYSVVIAVNWEVNFTFKALW